jgi:serine/threonine-protein kinase
MPYVVMELIDGPALHDVIAGGPLPWPQAAAIAAQVASGLAAAHARGLVHRDVKPGNVVLASTGAKLVDFGISAIAGDARSDGELLGTPAYVAPERLMGGRTSPAADVYALGVLLYRCVAGRMPWQTEGGNTEVLLAHLHEEPDPLPEPILAGEVDGSVPSQLSELCLRCLAKDPDERPSATDVVRVLTGLPQVPEAIAAGTSHPHGELDTSQTTILPVLVHDRPRTGVATAQVPAPTAVDQAPPAFGWPAAGPDLRRWLRPPVLAAMTGAMAIVGLGTVAAAALQEGPAGTAAAAGPAPTAACAAIYRLKSDDGSRFAGELTIINSGTSALRDWTVSFRYPGDQMAVGGGWRQVGAAVSRGPVDSELPAGERVTYPFRGTYRDVNSMPTSFQVGEVTCVVQLVGAVTVAEPAIETAKPRPPEPAGKSGPGAGNSGPGGGNRGPGGDEAKERGKPKGKGTGKDGEA